MAEIRLLGEGDYQVRQSANEGQRCAGIGCGRWLVLVSLGAAGAVNLSLILAVVYVRRFGNGAAGQGVAFGMPRRPRMPAPYTNHTTVADVPDLCAGIPRKIYRRRGTAADCAVAFALCMAVVAPHRVGLAGGFFATLYLRESKQVVVLDAHPSAPTDIGSEGPDSNDSSAAAAFHLGGKSVATPGYLPGLEQLHGRFGRLPWSSLFEDAILLARSGFPVYAELAAILDRFRTAISRRRSLKQIFWNRDTKAVYRENETLRQPELARTLTAVSREGAKALSLGSLAPQFLADLSQHGSLVSRGDMTFYRPLWKSPLRSAALGGVRLYAPPPPAAGALLAFTLATMDMFRPSRGDVLRQGPLTYHRLLEAIKFALPYREDLGDTAIERVDDTVRSMVSKGQALRANSRISDTSTYSDAIFYVFDMQLIQEAMRQVSERDQIEHSGDLPQADPPERHSRRGRGRNGGVYYDRVTRRRPSSSKNSTEPPTIKHAAANAVFLSPAGDVIAFSGSLGMLLGSREASSSTGLVLNNELHAFTDRGPDRYLGHAGVSLNYARPGKRPLSPLVPSVVLDAEGHELVAAVAASEDSQLPQYAALILCQLLLMNNTVTDAVTAPKVRFRASLKGVLYDTNLPLETVQELRNKGHHMLPIEDNVTNAAAIFRDEHKAFAAVNDRVGGYSDNN